MVAQQDNSAQASRTLDFRPTHRQWEAMQALRIPMTEQEWAGVEQEEGPIDVLWGGGKGGGKS